MQNALNLKNFRVFAQHVKGARLTEISVEKQTDGKPRLHYSCRDPRTRQVWNGDWLLDAKDPAAGEKAFMDLAGKENFAVRRREEEAKA